MQIYVNMIIDGKLHALKPNICTSKIKHKRMASNVIFKVTCAEYCYYVGLNHRTQIEANQ
jgi:hypothetical protein